MNLDPGDAPSAFPRPGEILGRFRIERRLGRGGMGVVLGAEDPDRRRRVALEVIAPRLVRDALARARARALFGAARAVRPPGAGEAAREVDVPSGAV